MTIDDLVSVLVRARDLYYNQGDSDYVEMSDEQFDALELKLKALDPQNPYFDTIGSEIRGGKIALPYPMGSLDQNYDGDTERWIKTNNWHDADFVITNKLDGTSGINVHGNNGRLTIAYSRGDGRFGADITRHVKNFKNLPKPTQPCVIRVEYIMTEESFQDILKAQSGRVFKNSRNYTAGRMNASDGDPLFYEHIQCIATEVIQPRMSKDEQLEFLTNMGYLTPTWFTCKGSELNDDMLLNHLEDQRSTYPYAIDGLVIDISNLDIRSNLTRKSSSLNPTYARKFKPYSAVTEVTTKVVNVEWNISKNGYLKPRVEVEPVELSGVTITFATGFNAKFIKENGIGPGAEVTICRSGDVIPFLTGVTTPVEPSMPNYPDMHWENDVDLVLDVETDEQIIQQLIAAFTALEVDGLKEGSILKLWDAKYRSLVDIITMTEQELITELGVNGSKIRKSLQQKLNPITKANLAGSSQIFPRGLGRRKFRKIFAAYPDANFEDLTLDMILSVEGFSDISAKNVLAGAPKFLDFLDKIDGYYSFETKPTVVAATNGPDYSNVAAIFSGVRSKELEAIIEAGGGQIVSSVGAKTTVLIVKDPASTSSKTEKARQLGVEIISLEEAYERFK